ncbi:hypothetical protein M011DRAFT_459475 [Sporormia fimetaria CBS 119925]|uniref:Uncharacterized protein n=1 Tax=Sporormia fimetaria CBS 119925 TaxID=1340428 RepID=A0A6A6VAM5_9PLEO|nr:hypothetical protein M011DRAFT_459475 [Sporormia fimetaria CBS 119925]
MLRSLLLVAISALVDADAILTARPGSHRRQDVSIVSSVVSSVISDAPVPTEGVWRRTHAPLPVERTQAWTFDSRRNGTIVWAPLTYDANEAYYTSSGRFWRGCRSTWSQTVGTDVSTYTTCPLYTTCLSDGWLVASGTSSFW